MAERPIASAERVVVVGAGIIGLAVGYELQRRGCPVLLVDRGAAGAGATQAAGGMLAPISEAETDSPLLLRFGVESLTRYAAFVRGLESLTGHDCGYRREGTVWAALDHDDLAELRHLATTLRDKGLDAAEREGPAIRALEPHLSHRVVGGLIVGGDHQVDPRRLVRALVEAVRSLGGELQEGVSINAVVATGGRVEGLRGTGADGAAFEIEASRVVLAAGAWSTAGIRSPLAAVGLRPVKGQLVRLRGARLLTRVVRTPHVYLVPRADGELLVGATMEEMGFDTSATAGAALDLLRHAREVLPGIYDLELTEISVGLRSAVADHLPVIGAAETAGLFAAFGHFRNGVLLAPATAHHLADWIEHGSAPDALAPFAPARGRWPHPVPQG